MKEWCSNLTAQDWAIQETIDKIDEILNVTVKNDESLEYELSSYDYDWLEVAKTNLEKQIPKKPYKIRGDKQNDYYCSICKCYLGDDMELKYACLQPKYCQHCGQALDWSDIK